MASAELWDIETHTSVSATTATATTSATTTSILPATIQQSTELKTSAELPRPSAVKCWHHTELPLCETRASYRQGRKLTAVKVYTVFDESCHLLLRNVTCINIEDELAALCARYGRIRRLRQLADYDPAEKFTRVFHLEYCRISSARYAKRHLDGRSFFGSRLAVSYATEMESDQQTLDKLMWRRSSYLRSLSGVARARSELISNTPATTDEAASATNSVGQANAAATDLTRTVGGVSETDREQQKQSTKRLASTQTSKIVFRNKRRRTLVFDV